MRDLPFNQLKPNVQQGTFDALSQNPFLLIPFWHVLVIFENSCNSRSSLRLRLLEEFDLCLET